MVCWRSFGAQNSGKASTWECFWAALWKFQVQERLSHEKRLARVLEALKNLHAFVMGVFLLGRSRSAKPKKHHLCGGRTLRWIEERKFNTTGGQLSAFPFENLGDKTHGSASIPIRTDQSKQATKELMSW